MLAQFRSFAKTPFATGIFVLAMLGFLFVGGRSVFTATSTSKAVIQAGGRSMTPEAFRQIFQRTLQSLAQRNGGTPPSVQEALQNNLDGRLLDEIAQEEALAAWTSRIGVLPADTLVADELRKQPQFFNPVSGAFDHKSYESLLAQNGLTPRKFEADLRDQIAQTQVVSGLVAGLRAPAAFSALETAFNKEARAASFFVIPATSVPPPPPPTDAQLQGYMREHAAGLKRPAMRQVSLIRFSASLLAPTVTVDEAALHKRYDFEKDSLSTAETRTFTQVPAGSPAQAQAVAAALKGGADPAAASRAAGAGAPVPYAAAARSAVPDAALAQAAFAMSPGETRVVQGSLGVSVVKLQSVAPGHAVSFEEARPKLEQEVRRTAAQAKANAQLQAYDDARNGGADFAEAARRAGVQPTPVPVFDAQGRTLQGQPLPVPPKLVQSAFALQPGVAGDIQDAAPGQGEFYVIRVDKALPAAPLTLDEVRAPLSRQIVMQAIGKALTDRAQALADRVTHGEKLEAVAASAGLAVQRVVIARDDQAAVQTYGQRFLGAVFGAKSGQVQVAPEVQANGMAVVRLDGVRTPPAAALAQAAQPVRAQATLALDQELAGRARIAAAARIRPRTNPALARKAIGVDAPPAPATTGAPARS